MSKNPYQIIKHIHATEKSATLRGLESKASNPSLRAFSSPKYTFIVDSQANKVEIAQAIESIYREQGVKVSQVNTMNVKGKPRRRGRYHGMTGTFKKAIVTLEAGSVIQELEIE